jgi:hypothetical protein
MKASSESGLWALTISRGVKSGIDMRRKYSVSHGAVIFRRGIKKAAGIRSRTGIYDSTYRNCVETQALNL